MKIININGLRWLLVALFGSLPLAAMAELQDQGDVTYDTETGFYWPDLTLTAGFEGYSNLRTDFVREFEPSGRFPGCRFPTEAEVADLVTKFGIPPRQTSCPTGYCGPIDPVYAERIEEVIQQLGDTRDARLDKDGSTIDVAPGGAGWALGYYVKGEFNIDDGPLWIRDGEFVSRATGEPTGDLSDVIHSDYDFSLDWRDGGALMICPTWPVVSQQSETLDFEDLAVGATGPLTVGDYRISGDIIVDLDSQGDKAVFFYPECTGAAYCDRSIFVDRIDGEPFAFLGQSSPPPTNAGFIVSCDDCGIYAFSPDGNIAEFDSFYYTLGTGEFLAAQTIEARWRFEVTEDALCDPCSFGLDDLEVAQAARSNSDFDPYSPTNGIRPKEDYILLMMVETRSIASGDEYDLNAADVLPSTVRLHDARSSREAAAMGSPFGYLAKDYDGDGDIDYSFGFNMRDTNLDCRTEEVVISGLLSDGRTFATRDTVVTENCTVVGAVTISPFGPEGVVYPDYDYVVLLNFDEPKVSTLSIGDVQLGYGRAETVTEFNADLNFEQSNSSPTRVFGFQMRDTDIACGDTEVPVIASIANGGPIPDKLVATGSITTEDCEVAACHP